MRHCRLPRRLLKSHGSICRHLETRSRSSVCHEESISTWAAFIDRFKLQFVCLCGGFWDAFDWWQFFRTLQPGPANKMRPAQSSYCSLTWLLSVLFMAARWRVVNTPTSHLTTPTHHVTFNLPTTAGEFVRIEMIILKWWPIRLLISIGRRFISRANLISWKFRWPRWCWPSRRQRQGNRRRRPHRRGNRRRRPHRRPGRRLQRPGGSGGGGGGFHRSFEGDFSHSFRTQWRWLEWNCNSLSVCYQLGLLFVVIRAWWRGDSGRGRVKEQMGVTLGFWEDQYWCVPDKWRIRSFWASFLSPPPSPPPCPPPLLPSRPAPRPLLTGLRQAYTLHPWWLSGTAQKNFCRT